jgi:hypothetical protein
LAQTHAITFTPEHIVDQTSQAKLHFFIAMPTKQALLVLACTSFTFSSPVSLTIFKDLPLQDVCAGKAAGSDCKLAVLLTGKCRDTGVSRSF